MDPTMLLLNACEDGDLETVRVLVEEQGADVNATHYYKYRTNTNQMFEVFPLFVAAANCNFEITKYLVGKEAEVNSRTNLKYNPDYAGLTPLQAAVSFPAIKFKFEKRKPVIEFLVANGADPSALINNRDPMWTLCEDEPDLVMLLINLGMSLTQRCTERKTILHHWASSQNEGAVFVVELLLEKGADHKAVDYYGITPLNAAAFFRYCHAVSGFSYAPHENPNEPVLRHLLQREEYSLLEKIDALELVGAMILIEKEDEVSVSKAFQYWNNSLDLRESAQESIPKIVVNANNIIHWWIIEWTTRDQLEELQQRLDDMKSMKIQAILVIRRILSRINSTAHHSSYLWGDFIHYYCTSLLDSERFSELLDICWIMLEGASLPSLAGEEEEEECQIVMTILVDIVYHMALSYEELKINRKRSPILTNSETLKLSLKLVSDTGRSSQHFHGRYGYHLMYKLCECLTILSICPDMVTQEISSSLNQFIMQDEQNEFEDGLDKKLLIYACTQRSSSKTIRLLLEAGVDPNATNEEGNTPLHFEVQWAQPLMEQDGSYSPIIQLLLEYGARFDQINKLGQTPLDIWRQKHERVGKIRPPPGRMIAVASLASWCAKIVRKRKIPYKHLPESLCEFVSMH